MYLFFITVFGFGFGFEHVTCFDSSRDSPGHNIVNLQNACQCVFITVYGIYQCLHDVQPHRFFTCVSVDTSDVFLL